MVLPVNSRFLKEYKLVVVGDRDAGRSALTVQFLENRFPYGDPDYYYDGSRKLCVIDEEVALIDVLDTLGDEAYIAMREQYMRTGEGFLLVYSVTSRQSFEKISTLHQDILRCKDKDSCPMIVVANKCDLEHERVVGINEGRDLAKHLGCKFIETSAKYGVNVDEAFMNLVREIRKYNKKLQSRPAAVRAAGNGGGKDHFCGCVVL